MPSSPRSELLLTARSNTVLCTAPPTTRLTFPVLFSNTRKSSGPRKAMPVGSVRPETTVLTERFGSTMHGSELGQGISAVTTAVPELFVGSGSGSLPRTVAVLLIWPGACGLTVITTATPAPAPTPIVPRSQVTVLVPLHVPAPAGATVAERNVTPAGSVSVTVTPVAIEGP